MGDDIRHDTGHAWNSRVVLACVEYGGRGVATPLSLWGQPDAILKEQHSIPKLVALWKPKLVALWKRGGRVAAQHLKEDAPSHAGGPVTVPAKVHF